VFFRLSSNISANDSLITFYLLCLITLTVSKAWKKAPAAREISELSELISCPERKQR